MSIDNITLSGVNSIERITRLAARFNSLGLPGKVATPIVNKTGQIIFKVEGLPLPSTQNMLYVGMNEVILDTLRAWIVDKEYKQQQREEKLLQSIMSKLTKEQRIAIGWYPDIYNKEEILSTLTKEEREYIEQLLEQLSK